MPKLTPADGGSSTEALSFVLMGNIIGVSTFCTFSRLFYFVSTYRGIPSVTNYGIVQQKETNVERIVRDIHIFGGGNYKPRKCGCNNAEK